MFLDKCQSVIIGHYRYLKLSLILDVDSRGFLQTFLVFETDEGPKCHDKKCFLQLMVIRS